MVSSLSSCTSSGDWSVFLNFSEEQTSPSTGLVSGNRKLVWRMYTTIKDAAIKVKQCLNQHSSSVLCYQLRPFQTNVDFFRWQTVFTLWPSDSVPFSFKAIKCPLCRGQFQIWKTLAAHCRQVHSTCHTICAVLIFFASTWPLDRGQWCYSLKSKWSCLSENCYLTFS